jgi:flagellar FliJ protein
MSSFRFRLDTLLGLRQADRDQRRADLAKAQRAEDALLAQAAALNGEQRQTHELSRRLSAPGEADIDALLRSHRYDLVLKTRSQQLAAQIEQVRAEVARRRQTLIEADRQVRVLEKLREKQRTAHQAGERRREQKQLDEQAVIAFVRREAAL